MRKITIVEDDPAIREELALLLENEGYQALAVTDFGDVPGQAGTLGRIWSCWIWDCPGGTVSPCAPSFGDDARSPSWW